MKATDMLVDEHRIIEGVLTTLEAGAQKLASRAAIAPRFFLDAADFIRNFADNCHHKKEEGVLFKTMVKHGFPEDQGPLAVMLAEHEQGRAFTRAMSDAAQKFERGDQSVREEIIMNALAYVSLLRQHIQKENNILFRMADNVIPPAEHADVEAGFARVEREEIGRGVHEKYEAVAEALSDQLNATS